MLVASRPLIKIISKLAPNRRKVFEGGEGPSLPFEQLVYFRYGRDALLYILEKLELKKNSRILFPAYYCDSALLPLRDSGYSLIYFDVEQDLSWDTHKIINIMKRNKVNALVLPDIFGLQSIDINEISKQCFDSNIYFIVDFSHSFYSFNIEDFKIPVAPAACFFSMRKILPTSDGGALFMGKPSDENENTILISSSILKDISFIFRSMLEYLVIGFGYLNIYGGIIEEFKRRKNDKINSSVNYNKEKLTPSTPSFLLLKQLKDKNYLSLVSKKRVKNYRQLYSLVHNFAPELLFMKLAKGSTPQVLPLLDKTGTLVKYLRSVGVGAYLWPGNDLPLEVRNEIHNYPNTVMLGYSVVCLPIHQDIINKDINYMAYHIEIWKNKTNND